MIHYVTTQGMADAWVGNELRVVRAAGVPTQLHALREPGMPYFREPWARELNAATRVIYPLPPAGLVLSLLLAPLLFRTRFLAALANALFGERESLRARLVTLGHLGVACHWARGLRGAPPSLVHSQWIHSAGSVAMYGAWLLGVPFSFTGHAADLFRDRVALRDKIRRAAFIVCISSFHRDFFLGEGAREDQLHVVYCGIDPRAIAPRATGPRPGPESERPFTILSSGRLVEKKGFADLIEACRLLRERGLDFRCEIAGSGPLERELRALVAGLDLEDRVSVTGRALRQDELPEFMARGDAYCLACVWARDRDVDGLPQMLMEAMACEKPVVSTRLVGIPDLVRDGENGLLCEPGRPDELADRLARLARDPAAARRLALAGRRTVLERFDIDTCLEPLIGLFRQHLPAATRTRARSDDAAEAAGEGAGERGRALPPEAHVGGSA